MIYELERFKGILNVVSGYTGLQPARLKTLWLLTLNLNEQNIPGDIVECGVRDGGSAAVLAAAMGDRRIWLYDSFQGHPKTSPKDGERAKREIGGAVGSTDKVHEVMSKVGINKNQYIIKKGWFKDTFKHKGKAPNHIALLHCDADWYEPTLLTLRTFYDQVVEGGYVVLDDFAGWEGQRIAFYEFCQEKGEMPLVERIEERQLWWRKGKKHNRFKDEPRWHTEWQLL